MDNRNYLVIGGSTGIGKAITSILCDNGEVFITSRNKPLSNNQKFTKWIPYDVLSEDFPTDQLPNKLDGVAYCPGTINLKPFHTLKPEDFLNDFSINVVGAVRCLQAVLPQLKRAELPGIVLFSTVAASRGMHFHSSIASSKSAVEGLTRSLAAELAPNIRVNAIAPSLTDTPLASKLLASETRKTASAERHPLKRIGQPNDIAQMAAFLMGPSAAWITGQIIGVDGGLSSIQL